MTFLWSQFVEIAEYLKNQGDINQIPQEAAYRCSVSRAYYGAYRYALDYAKDVGDYIPSYDGKDHKNLRIWFKDNQKGQINRKLGRLHQWRKECDYNEPFQQIPNLSMCVRNSISEAKCVIENLK